METPDRKEIYEILKPLFDELKNRVHNSVEVICDETTNTKESIDRNELHFVIKIPTWITEVDKKNMNKKAKSECNSCGGLGFYMKKLITKFSNGDTLENHELDVLYKYYSKLVADTAHLDGAFILFKMELWRRMDTLSGYRFQRKLVK